MISYKINTMQKSLTLLLCLIAINLSACDHQNSKQQTLEVTTPAPPLSRNNTPDLLADIASLQSLQALFDEEKKRLFTALGKFKQQKNTNEFKKLQVELQTFNQQYTTALNQLSLKSQEAEHYRNKVKAFNQFNLELQQLELQDQTNQQKIKQLTEQLKQAESEQNTAYREMEKAVIPIKTEKSSQSQLNTHQ